MRTTIRLEDDLEREIRQLAAAEGVSFGRFVNRLLRRALRAPSTDSKPRRRFKEKPARLGPAAIDLTKALLLAGQLEDEETLKKLALRK